jgi:methylmalonyl-CoA mutase C-terminal domain/subunit
MTGPTPDATAGSRGRVVIGMLGLDQHETGALAVSQLLVRNGFEVVYVGRFNTPEMLAEAAAQEDADVVGVSVHSWELDGYVDELVARCHEAGAAVVVGGSVLTERDRASLTARGVDAVFLAYAGEDEIVPELDRLVLQRVPGS